MCQLGMIVMGLEHVWGQICSCHEESPGCLQVAPPVLQDPQVVVGLSMVIVRHQGQPEALVGQVDVPNALKNGAETSYELTCLAHEVTSIT